MKLNKKLFFIVLLLMVIQSIQSVHAQETVDTVNILTGDEGFLRKSFEDAGMFFNFYTDGTNAGWKASDDGITWTGDFTSIGACTTNQELDIDFDGTYVHYIRKTGYFIYYRRGIPVDDGTIAWSEAEQTLHAGSVLNQYFSISISVDSNGYAWFGGGYFSAPGAVPRVIKNANNDGTWSPDFVYTLTTTDDWTWHVSVVPLTEGKVYAIYSRAGMPLLGNLYDSGWDGEENDLADYDIDEGEQFSAVAIEDNVHVVYNRETTSQIRHNERVWGVGWDVNDVLVTDIGGFYTQPTLSSNPSNNALYCFWVLMSTDHVYYKMYSGDTWGDLVDWIDESTDDIAIRAISSFYMDYGGYIGVLYRTEPPSPYKVRFAFIEVPVPELPVIGNVNLLFGAGFNHSTPYVYIMWNYTGYVNNYEIYHSSDNVTYVSLVLTPNRYYNHTSLINGSYHYYKIRSTYFNSSWYNSSFSAINLERVWFIRPPSIIGDNITLINGSWINYNVSKVYVIRGTYVSGDLTSLELDDADYYLVNEVTGVEGFDIRFNFTNIPNNTIALSHRILCEYEGNPAHDVDIEVWNFTRNAWVDSIHVPEHGFRWLNNSMSLNSIDFNDGGNVWLRIVHHTSGVNTHYLNVDYFQLRAFSPIYIPAISGGVGLIWWIGAIFIFVPVFLVLAYVLRGK